MTEEVKNKGGRPPGGRNRRSSKLRKTEAAFQKMNAAAVEIVEQSLAGDKVDDKKLTTAKWVITTTISLSKSAIAEEQVLNADLDKLAPQPFESETQDQEQDREEQEEQDSRPVFSLVAPKKVS